MKIEKDIHELIGIINADNSSNRNKYNTEGNEALLILLMRILKGFRIPVTTRNKNALVELARNATFFRDGSERMNDHLNRISEWAGPRGEEGFARRLARLPAEEIFLSDEDEAALDRAWDNIGKSGILKQHTMKKLLENIIQFDKDSPILERDFYRIAKELFEKIILERDGKYRYRLTEIEFYYQSEEHPDPYVYSKPEQKEFGRFFRHGTGIDITFGDGKSFGGILIRGVKPLNQENAEGRKEFYSGPWNTLKELSDGNTQISQEDLNEKLKIERSDNKSNFILVSTRVGLRPGEKELTPDYLDRKYRFIANIAPNQPFREKTKVAQCSLEFYGEKKKDDILNCFTYNILK